jgi:hypothetical protein
MKNTETGVTQCENAKMIKLLTYDRDNLPNDKKLREIVMEAMDLADVDKITTRQLWAISLASLFQLNRFSDIATEEDKDAVKEYLNFVKENIELMLFLLNM